MFGNLIKGSRVYLLNKSDATMNIGEVSNIGAPQPMYGASFTPNVMQPQKTTIDISVKLGERTIEIKQLPSENNVANFESDNMIVCENQDTLVSEIENLRKRSQDVLDSMDRHQTIVINCDDLLREMNPRAKEIDNLREELKDVKELLSQLINSKDKKETSF